MWEAFSLTDNDRAPLSSPMPPCTLHRHTISGDDALYVGSPVNSADTVTEADGLVDHVNQCLAVLVLCGRTPVCVRRRKVNRSFELVCVELNPGPPKKTKAAKKKATKMAAHIRTNIMMIPRPARDSGPANRTTLSGVPAAFGLVAPRAYFTMGGSAQKLADQDDKNAVRARGCALLNRAVFVNPAVNSSVAGALDDSGSSGNGTAILSPNTVDPRLNALSQTYQYYAFRRLVLKYIPFVGTQTTGGLYIAIGKDADQALANFEIATPGQTGFDGGSPQNVMEFDPSVMTAVWQPSMLEFKHTGTELWQTFPNGEEPTNERIQAVIVALAEASFVAGTSVAYGHLWLEYEIDFYIPGPPLGIGSSGGQFFFPVAAQTVTASGTSTPVTVANLTSQRSAAGPALFSTGLSVGTNQQIQFTLTDVATGVTTNIGDQFPVSTTGSGSFATIGMELAAGTEWLVGIVSNAAAAVNLFNTVWKSAL